MQPPTGLQTGQRSSEVKHFDCGCFYQRESVGDETLILRMEVCSLCMNTQFSMLSAIDNSAQLTIDLPSREGRPEFNYG